MRVDTTSCGGAGRARGGERWRPTRPQQGNSDAFEFCRGDNIDGGRDRCWTQVPLTEGNGKPSAAAGLPLFEFGQDVPPSPLPSPPVPLSPTARRGTSTVGRLPPTSRVLSASGSTLLQQYRDVSCVSSAPTSNPNKLCSETVSAFGIGNEAPTTMPRTAKNEAPGGEKVLSPSKDSLSERCAWESTAGVRGDGGVGEGTIGQVPQTGGASSPQPRLADRVGPPETALLQDMAAPAGDHLPPKVQRQSGASISSPTSLSSTNTSSSEDCKNDPTSSSPSAQKTRAAQYFGRGTGTQAEALNGTTHHGINTAVSLPACTRAPCEASPEADQDRLKDQAQLSKTVVVLTLQRWVRCAVLRRKDTSGCVGGAKQRRSRELNEPKNVQQLQPAESSAASARQHPREARMEGALHVHFGASPSENKPVAIESTALLVPHEGSHISDAIPPYWEEDPIRDRSHALPPRNGLVVNSADRDSFEKAPVSSSPAIAGGDDLSHERPGKKPGSIAEIGADQRGRQDSCRDGGTTPPSELASPGETASTDVDQVPNTPTSTVLISGPNASPPQSKSLPKGLSSPVAPRLKPDDHLQPSKQPSEREEGTIDPNGNPKSGGRDCNSARGMQHHALLSPTVYHRVRAARDMPRYSFVALGRPVAPADAGCNKVGDGYGLTVQEACLPPPSRQVEGGRAPCRFRESFVVPVNRESCHGDAVRSTAAKIPEVTSAPHHQRQEDRPSELLARAFARHVKTNIGEDLGGNPLLDAWGVRNPLLTRSPGAVAGTSGGGGAPYG